MNKIQTTEEALAQLELDYLSSGLDKEGNKIEQNKEEDVKDPSDINDAPVQSEDNTDLSEFEQEQQSLGWDPKGEKTAEEWAKDGELYRAIKDRNKEIKTLKRTIEELKTLQQKQGELIYQQIMTQLEQEQKNAEVKGDKEALKIVEQKQKQAQATVSPLIPQEVLDFQERNIDWWNGKGWKEQEMRDFALKRDNELMKLKLPINEHMDMLEKEVKEKFNSYFNKDLNEKKVKIPAVEGNNGIGIVKNSKRQYTIDDLNPEQKRAAKDFARLKVMPIDKYIDELVALGELK